MENKNKTLELACRDVGIDCDKVVTGQTKEEVMERIARHAADSHDLTYFPPNIEKKCMEAIKESD